MFRENILEKLPQRTKVVYGPLARIWSYLEEDNSSGDETVDVDIDTLLTCTQQSVLLLAQAMNSLLYDRRYNA